MMPDRIPPEWRTVTYGEVLTEDHERADSNIDLPVLSVTKSRGLMLASERFGKPLHSRDLSRYRVARRHVVVADPMLLWDGAIGTQRVVDAGLVSPDYRVYRHVDGVDPSFMDVVVRSPTMLARYQGGARGTNVRRNRIARSDFLSIPLSMPPLREQRKIATILSSVDDAIESTQAVIDQLGVVKKAMMAELLTRGLPGRHTKFKQTEIGEVPEVWEIIRASGLASAEAHSFVLGPFGSDLVAADYRDQGVPVVFVRDIKPNAFRWKSNVFVTREKAAQLHAHRVVPGDVVITKMGFPAGIAAVYPDDMAEGIVTADIVRLRADAKRVSPTFIAYCINGPTVAAQVDRITGGQTRPKVTLRDFKEILVSLPTADEQMEIAVVLESVESRISEETSCMRELYAVKSALMSVLLTGEVRVTPDEPTP